jgi:hypothetical protein
MIRSLSDCREAEGGCDKTPVGNVSPVNGARCGNEGFNSVDLDAYRGGGDALLSGRLGDEEVAVVITAYALGRMRQRDIDQSEVLKVLAAPRSAHGGGKGPGRHEVAWETDRGRVRVVYERPEPGIVRVITTYPERE